ncbi:OmpA family protein [Acinetobacter baretiae]|uniref:OmpA family protein n=1 Tax=Acinetobacter baretiae TaxID=2605383 RepID=UPI0038B2C177
MNKLLQVTLLSVLSLQLLTGCQLGGVNYKQSLMLQREGFRLADEGWTLGLSERILFDFDKSKVTPQQQASLTLLAQELSKYKLYRLKIIGHTDDLGGSEYNTKLSKGRAESVADIFYQNGFSHENIIVIGRGSSEPLNINDSEEHRANNRRVTIIVTP